MGHTHLIANILGYMGNVAALVLFLSPIKTFIKIFKNRSTLNFSALTYVVTWMNCVLWVMYGNLKGVTLIQTINGAGIIIQTIYIVIFLVFASTRRERLKVMAVWLIEIFCVLAIALGIVYGLRHHKHKAITILGILAVVFNIGMYWAPLSVMAMVLKTRSVEYMPLPLTMMVMVNSVFWTVYALLDFNVFVIIPNALGLVGGLVQVALYFVYWKTLESKAALAKKPKETELGAEPSKKPVDVELQKPSI